MIKRKGFNLIELLVVGLLILMVLAIATNFFILIMRQSPKEVKKTESEVESLIALETLRIDIENSGLGLPWAFQSEITYAEASSEPCSGVTTNDATSSEPRAIFTCNDAELNNSDRLIIKAINVAINDTSQLWTYIDPAGVHLWPNANQNFQTNDRIITIRPKVNENTFKMLVMNGSTYSVQFSSISSLPIRMGDIVYGVDADSNLRFPFNRADYFIRRNASTPDYCQAGTGVLYKATLNHSNGNFRLFPIMDCVADFQVVFFLDTDNNGIIDAETQDISALNARNIREQVKEVRVFLLFHEGQIDIKYRYPFNTAQVGNKNFDFENDLSDNTDWRNYHWNVYTIATKLKNLE